MVQEFSGLGKFGLIYADPPWQCRDKLAKNRTLARFYPTMPTREIARLPVEDVAQKDSVLLLWSIAAMLPEALEVMSSWGFGYKTCAIWIKPRFGMGHYFRTAHELLLLGTRGKPKVNFHGQPSWIFAPVQQHSHKPEEFYEVIERMFSGPYLELFATSHREGWRVWGLNMPPTTKFIQTYEEVTIE